MALNVSREKIKESSNCQKTNILDFNCIVSVNSFEAIVINLLISTEGIIFRKKFSETMKKTDLDINNGCSLEFLSEEIDQAKGFVLIRNKVVIVDLNEFEEYLSSF